MNSTASPAGLGPGRLVARLRQWAPGIAVAAAVAVAGDLAERGLGLAGLRFPAIVIALVIGMALHGVTRAPRLQPGLTFCVKTLLRWAIALLGLRIVLSDIVALGLPVALLVIATMALTILSGLAFARLLGRSDAFGALAGGATAVCGASAALAISTVLPATREREADTVFTVLAVNALSTVAMLAYPLAATLLGFSDHATGILLGATIHDVAQVVGAGYAVSTTAGDTALIVKLFRVFMLLPVVIVIGLIFSGRGGAGARARAPVPVFALVFLALAGVNSFGLVPEWARIVLLEVSRWGLLVAIAALGLNTAVRAMLKLGWRHLAVVSGATLLLLAMVLVPVAAGWI